MSRKNPRATVFRIHQHLNIAGLKTKPSSMPRIPNPKLGSSRRDLAKFKAYLAEADEWEIFGAMQELQMSHPERAQTIWVAADVRKDGTPRALGSPVLNRRLRMGLLLNAAVEWIAGRGAMVRGLSQWEIAELVRPYAFGSDGWAPGKVVSRTTVYTDLQALLRAGFFRRAPVQRPEKSRGARATDLLECEVRKVAREYINPKTGEIETTFTHQTTSRHFLSLSAHAEVELRTEQLRATGREDQVPGIGVVKMVEELAQRPRSGPAKPKPVEAKPQSSRALRRIADLAAQFLTSPGRPLPQT